MWTDKERVYVMSEHHHSTHRPAVSVAQIHSFPVMPQSYRISFHPTVKQLIKQSLTPSLPVFPCNSQGGATVPVHPGLQGDVQAFTRGVAEERVGCVRGADPWGGQRRRAAASEGSRV